MKRCLSTVVIADDLTGAADTGVQFAASVGCACMTGVPLPESVLQFPGFRVLSVFTSTRHVAKAEAAVRIRMVGAALKRFAPLTVYKKIDSCLRGNLGVELDTLVDEFGCEASLVVPALPAQGRITVNDIHQVNGIPLAQSEIGRDPQNPVTESRLSMLLAAQSRMPVAHVPLLEVEKGPQHLQSVIAGLIGRGYRHIACDAENRSHLDALATVSRFFPELLLAGSAGLAQSLVPRPTGKASAAPPAERNRMLWVCGSASAILTAQLACLQERSGVAPVVLPDTLLAQGPTRAATATITGQVTDGWKRGVRILTIGPTTESEPTVDPNRLVAGLAKVAAAIIKEASCDSVFMTGGDTAEALWQRLGAKAMLIQGEVLPGVIWGRWLGGALHGKTAVTKAGGFGAEASLHQLHQILIEKG